MKYFIKAITTNNRDLKAGIMFQIEDKAYLFNCPDGFQRMALNQKMKFKSIRHVFISSLHPDHYCGFPGFYLSTRETNSQNANDLKNFKIGVFGPSQLKNFILRGKPFIGFLNNIEIFEYGNLKQYFSERIVEGRPQYQLFYLNSNENAGSNGNAQNIEEAKQQNNQDEEEKKSYEVKEVNNIDTSVFEDEYLKILPVKVYSIDQRELDTYSFICIPKQSKGKFLPQKAVELGLDPRYHFKILNNGQPVTLENGDVVYPFQVMEKPLPSQSVIFFFIPNSNYLQSFLSEENQKLFEPFFERNINQEETQIHLIYHSISFDVLMNEKYRDFMKQFGENVRHIIDCESTSDEILAKTKSYALSQRHKIICPSLIPLPSNPKLRPYEQETKEQLKQFYDGFNFINSKMGMTCNLYPMQLQGENKQGIICQEEYDNDIEKDLRISLKQTVQSLLQMKKLEDPTFEYQDQINADTEFTDEEPQILFLGTISMKPTMYRSASAVYVFIKGHGILMDSAEGSYGQLYDHFQDVEKLNNSIRNMRVVFITHIHGDHQLGIIKIMSERDKLLADYDPNSKLYIVTPQPMYDYLDEVRQTILRNPENVVLVPISDLNPEPKLYYDNEIQPHNPKKPTSFYNQQQNPAAQSIESPVRSFEEVNQMMDNHTPRDPRSLEMLKVLQETMNVRHLKAIETNHCTESFACLIESKDFGRIFYSGDTKPCQTVLNYAQKVTLLIHEATFDDELTADADVKKHTTMGQAINISKACQPWRTVLTHFSPRYQKIAETDQRHIDNKIMVAFDHMRFKLSFLDWAYRYLDIYKRFFNNDDSIDTYEESLKQKNGQSVKIDTTQKQKNQKQVRQKTE